MSATLFIAALAVAAPAHTAAPVKFDVKAGTKLTYKSVSTTAFDGMGQTFNTTVKQTTSHESEGSTEGWTRMKVTVLEHAVESDMPFGEVPDPTGLATSVLVSGARRQKEFKVVSNGKMSTDQIDILAKSAKTEMEVGFEGLSLPEGELATGTTWELEHNPTGAGMAGMPTTTVGKIKTSYKVIEIKDGSAVVEAKSVGSFQLTIESPQGTFSMDCKLDETRTYTVRTADGVVTKTAVTSVQAMSSEFGDFSTKTTATTELQK
jgi:hypothetical protein